MAALTDEPARAEVESLLRSVEDPPAISAICIAEIVDVLVRRRGFTSEAVEQRLDWLVAAALEVVSVDEQIARLAGEIRARRYDRAIRPVSMADCVTAATALARNEALATADEALATTARLEGIRVIPLPNVEGHRPPPGTVGPLGRT